MMKQRTWFDRVFSLGHPVDAFPEILERLRGTPARLEERVAHVGSTVGTRRIDEAWSIHQQVGHLCDLETLWTGRLNDLLIGAERLGAADLKNEATQSAGHDDVEMCVLLLRFRRLRADLVRRLEGLEDGDLARTALHPRLEQPMSTVDLFFFVAEHDDHHLASITRLLTGADR
ncbi:MAG: DinB family protein [Gemmatimonadetes bacterium]|nr:DinB family protein [Gemmatimonadota bacterium]